jgi:hypothetical protein
MSKATSKKNKLLGRSINDQLGLIFNWLKQNHLTLKEAVELMNDIIEFKVQSELNKEKIKKNKGLIK